MPTIGEIRRAFDDLHLDPEHITLVNIGNPDVHIDNTRDVLSLLCKHGLMLL